MKMNNEDDPATMNEKQGHGFDCPGCDKVAGRLMATDGDVGRCPDCSASIVIDDRGHEIIREMIKEAFC
jgi:hypothetical protein